MCWKDSRVEKVRIASFKLVAVSKMDKQEEIEGLEEGIKIQGRGAGIRK